MKIFIDPGHNPSGWDTGAEGNGLKEQDITLAIARKLKPMLIALGHDVKMSREADDDRVGTNLNESLNGRCRMSNEWGADLFISIHCNSGGGIGTETYVYSTSSASAAYAKKIQQAVVDKLDMTNRGVKTNPRLAVLRGTKCPALLLETGFIDNTSDAAKLKDRQDDFAAAIAEGLAGKTVNKEDNTTALTVQKLDNIYVQEINPLDFDLYVCDCKKRNVSVANYFNAGFFATEKGGATIPVGNIAVDGKIIAQAKDNPSWVNVAKKALTTLYVQNDGSVGLYKTDKLTDISGLKTAISGIPIIVGGKQVTMDDIKSEGYFGNELYDTWHGFLGIRHGKLVYVAAKCPFGQMCWIMVALGIYDAIKLDGGGSFILHNGQEIEGTDENRRINNVGMWK